MGIILWRAYHFKEISKDFQWFQSKSERVWKISAHESLHELSRPDTEEIVSQ